MHLPRIGRRRIAALGLATAAITVAASLAGAPAFAAPSEGEILNAGGATAISDSYIVVFRDTAVARAKVGDSARGLASKHGGSVARTYGTALRGFEANLSAKAAARIAADPAVAYVEQNHTVTIQGTQTNPPSWGLDRIDQRNLPRDQSYTYPSTATNVHAYIIDTGIRLTHNDFGGRATSGYDAIDGGSADDCNGHGTHVAGTVGGSSYGVAKGVALVAVRVLDCDGYGTNAGVIAGVDWVTANAIKPAVANMSLGGGAYSALDTAVRNSISSGVVYAVAAGNESTNASGSSPARVTEAITVGATTSSDTFASYSNYGSVVDILAPGSSITSAWYTSNTATNTISGTSMATPHVAGAAALVLATNPAWTPQQVRDQLATNATSGVISGVPSGTPNLLLYVGSAGSTPPPTPTPGCSGTNGTDVSIPDNATVSSSIVISGCSGYASSTSTVEVHIVHTWRGDLVVSLVAPDGSVYTLLNRSGGSADNVDQTFTVNLSSETANGTWTLRVQDAATGDTGYINSWTLTL